MVRAIGIDPGTISFDVCGLEDDRLFLDETIPSKDLAADPSRLVELLHRSGPVDVIIGPSGYGLPWVNIQDLDAEQRSLLLLNRMEDRGSETILEGFGRVLRLLQQSGLPILLAPGVIHLDSVPVHRKVNRIDMGTCDKVCAAALGVYDQARHLGIAYDETSFLYVELGGAFTAILAVEGGVIVDGMGGTSGSLGFLAAGAMDGEVAYLLGDFPKGTLASGGAAFVAGEPDAAPEELFSRADVDRHSRVAWDALIESLIKGVASLRPIVSSPKEILLSGRLCRVPAVLQSVKEALAPFGPVRQVEGFAAVAKEAAQGAALIADGMAGGRNATLVDTMRLREADGTVLDHLYVLGGDRLRATM